jgi:TonB family protein
MSLGFHALFILAVVLWMPPLFTHQPPPHDVELAAPASLDPPRPAAAPSGVGAGESRRFAGHGEGEGRSFAPGRSLRPRPQLGVLGAPAARALGDPGEPTPFVERFGNESSAPIPGAATSVEQPPLLTRIGKDGASPLPAAADPAPACGRGGGGDGGGGGGGGGVGGPGRGGGGAGADGPLWLNGPDRRYALYFRGIYRKVDRLWKFPKALEVEFEQGDVLVQFTILADGNVREVRVRKSSGLPAFDHNVVAAIRRAAPFGPIPQGLGRSLRVLAPFEFSNPMVR